MVLSVHLAPIAWWIDFIDIQFSDTFSGELQGEYSRHYWGKLSQIVSIEALYSRLKIQSTHEGPNDH